MKKGYSERFLRFVREFVFPHECAYAKGRHGDMGHVVWENVPGDGGGVTKYGIDQRSHPELDIKRLTEEQAVGVYWRDYWVKSGAEDLPAGFGEVLCDVRINGGNGVLMLQVACNKVRVRRGMVDLPVLHEDGEMGPMTRRVMEVLGEGALVQLLRERQARYDRLAAKPRLKKFHQGWTNRNEDLAEYVGVNLGR